MLEIKVENKKTLAIIHIKGGFNIETVSNLETVMDAQIKKNPETIAINCGSLDQIDSTAIGALVRYLNLCKKKRIEIIFYNMPFMIMDLFKTSKLNKFFTILTLGEFEKKYTP